MPSPPIGDHEHAWFRARLEARALDLLDEGEERRFQAHAESCASCGAALKAHTQSAARIAREGHIPAGLLARWDRTSKKLRGMARRMVREHLRSCAECRQDLEAIGFRPELEHVAELESDPEEPAADAPIDPAPVRVVLSPRRPWRPWVLGGAAGAALATAASFLLVTILPAPRVTDDEPAIMAPGDSPVPAPPGTGPILDLLPPSGTLAGMLRGPTREITTIGIGPGTRFVHLGVPELFLPDTESVELRVLGPDGVRSAEIRLPYRELHARRTVLYGDPAAALVPGEYRLVVSAPFSSHPNLGEFRFRLTR